MEGGSPETYKLYYGLYGGPLVGIWKLLICPQNNDLMDYSTRLLKQPELIGRNWLIVRFGGSLSGQSSFRLSPLLFPLLEKMKHFLLIHFTHYYLLFGFANLAYWANLMYNPTEHPI